MNNKLTIKHDCVTGSEFEDLNLSGSTFQNINLSGAHFGDINFTDGIFSAANIGGTLFKHIGPAPDKDGKQARQRPVTFEEAMLCDSTILHCDLSGVKIVECDLAGMTIDGILVTDLLKAWTGKNG